jgi:hypothetical protein
MDDSRRPHGIFFPILLVVVGIFFLLANLGIIQNTVGGILITYWPLIFVIGGLDGLYRSEGWVGPLVGIGLGTILLLGNLHYLQWGSLDLLLRLWPILLVAWGLDIAFGHNHSVWSTLVRVGLGLLLVVGIIWIAIASPFGGGVKTVAFTQALDGAKQSSLNFSVAAGELTLSGGAEDNTLVKGTIGLPKDTNLTPDYQAPTDGSSSYTLEGAGVVLIPMGTSIPWNLKVNSVIPIELTSRLGAGNMVLDLSGVKISDFDSELAVGRSVITLPRKRSATGKVQVAVGELVIRVPKGTHVIIHSSIGAATRLLPAGYTETNGLIQSNAGGDDVVEFTANVAVGSLVIQEIS